jgi:TolB-like protein
MQTPVSHAPFIFVSYAHPDEARIRDDITALRAVADTVWLDENIGAGTPWREEIAGAIERCDVFLFFVSVASIASEHCQRELNYALETRRRIIAVHLEPTELSSGQKMSLMDRQAILRYQLSADQYRGSLTSGVMNEPPPSASPAAPSPESTPLRGSLARRTLIYIGLPVLSILVVWGGWQLISPDVDAQGSADALAANLSVEGMVNVSDFDGRPAIAVLPFDNLSPDPEQAFFADGLAEDLITRLASWRAFPVIARNSSFQYRGEGLDMVRVGQELAVRYLVNGSVRRAGDQIRVTARLVDARSLEHVWAETYDRAVSDLFSLQDEISSTIAASLVGDLTRAEAARAHQQDPESLEAWSLYQLGLHYADRYTSADAQKAAQYFEQALTLDPRFAAASAQLAMANWMILTGDGSDATEEQIAAAFAGARQAIKLDPRDPIAHAALGAIYLTAGDAQNAVDATRRAVELNPSMPLAWIWYGFAQVLAGDPQACIAATKRAQRLDPHGPSVWIYDSLALAYWEAGDYEASLTAGRRLVATHPTYFTGYLYVAMSAVSLGRIEEARAAIEEGRRARPDLSLELMQNYLAVARPAIDARRNAALRKAGLD